jgi:lipopolysaccharide/colanic/teichoic acid biosynthesis glycosyltransferase
MYRVSKRILDILVSISAIIILAPAFILIIIMLRFSAEGEVFYLQERIGYKNSKFMIIKFATMLKNSLEMGSGSITLKNDFRVTGPGKILRKTKLNETPQLINLLIGDISLVGPRPVLESDYLLYTKSIQSTIYKVKPGLTGIGSIVFRDEESLISAAKQEDPHEFYKRVIAPYKGELEMWYQDHKSFLLDLKLIFMTAWVILFPKSYLYKKWFKNLPERCF